MKTKFKVVKLNTGKYGARQFRIGTNMGYYYLFKGTSGSLAITKLQSRRVQDQIQFDTPEEVEYLLTKFNEEQTVTLKVVKEIINENK